MKKSQLKQLIRECVQEVLEEGVFSRLGGLGLAGALALSPAAFGGQPSAPSKKPAVSQTRGIRNNNPGNIRKSNIKWQGATGNDGTFVVFKSPEDGIRALSRILKTYNNKYGLNTPAGIIHRWAPSSENDTKKYIQFVSKKTGKSPNEKLDINNPTDIENLVTAIIQYENGSVPYDSATIRKGIEKP